MRRLDAALLGAGLRTKAAASWDRGRPTRNECDRKRMARFEGR